jgi:hypothetical protein
MFDEYLDVKPEDDVGYHLPNQMNNEDNKEDEDFSTL